MNIPTDDSSHSPYSFPASPAFEFPVAAHLARRLRLASPSPGSYYSDELVQLLIGDLESESPEPRRLAAMELRLLAKEDDTARTSGSIRLRIARAGALPPLVDLISHRGGAAPDPELHEHAVTAILNVSLSPGNAAPVMESGAVAPLCRAVADGAATPAARANAACALMRLARSGGAVASRAIGRAGAVPALAALLADDGATLQEHKDAAAALYALCSAGAENARRAVEAGAVETLVTLVAEEVLDDVEEVATARSSPPRRACCSSFSSSSSSSGMADRALCVLSAIVATGGPAAAKAVAGSGGVGVMVEVLQGGTRRQREAAADVLMGVCGREGSDPFRRMAAREGAVPPLLELAQTGSPRAKKTAEALTALLRLPRTGSSGSSGSGTGTMADQRAT